MAKYERRLLYQSCVIVMILFCEGEKRLILHSSDDIASEFQLIRQEIEVLKSNYSREIQALKTNHSREIQALKANHSQEIQALKADHSQEIQAIKANYSQEIQALRAMSDDHGSTYVRWGKTTCGGNGTEKVYSGFTAGTPYELNGAGSNLCLPRHPTWAKFKDGTQDIGGKISGTEYQTYPTFEPFPKMMSSEDVPCVVCRSPRPTTLIIPGRKDCYSGWTIEYVGYLMSGHSSHTGNADYACVDMDPEAVYHGEADLDGKLFYLNEVKCGSLPCQEYPDGRELACVVCSK